MTCVRYGCDIFAPSLRNGLLCGISRFIPKCTILLHSRGKISFVEYHARRNVRSVKVSSNKEIRMVVINVRMRRGKVMLQTFRYAA